LPRAAFPILAVLALGLTACGGDQPGPPAPLPKHEAPQAVGYFTPPAATGAVVTGEQVVLAGTAKAGAQVRLATPDGMASFARADAKGRWRLAVPASEEARLFGLSQINEGRTVQSQGYLLLTPTGEAVLLRAGAGALRLSPSPKGTLTAFDFDRDGGTLVSGSATPGSKLTVQVDGQQSAQGVVDRSGRFAVALAQPLRPGAHAIGISGDFGQNTATLDATPAAPLARGPFRAATTPTGLRVDWMTPGGGVQSTLITD
jgi:hypothetical protein